MNQTSKTRIKLSQATPGERDAIHRARHQVYAIELGQYAQRDDGVLPDADDIQSCYLIASLDDELVGFIGITPPTSPRFSVDRYIAREEIPFAWDERTFEIRALTVLNAQRGSIIAAALMYAAFRWAEARGAARLIAIGRRDVKAMYLAVGLQEMNCSFHSGAVTYDLLSAGIEEVRGKLSHFEGSLRRMEQSLDWQVGVAFRRPSDCYHGGAFFEAVGDEFDDLRRSDEIINADVLDAWFPPAPKVKEALEAHLDWIMRTSPPNQAEGLCRQIAAARGIEPESILAGGGSSPLIFLALRQWLGKSSRVLLLEPTYGEYAHVLEQVIGCRVERFILNREEGYQVNAQRLTKQLRHGYDLFIWVNPNNPTGCHVPKVVAQEILKAAPPATRIWIDETYIDYVAANQSLESFAAASENVVVCKSLSKACALSGLRVGYLCAPMHRLEDLRGLTPPWSVSLAAQIAAVAALQSPDYYQQRYAETHQLREQLFRGLQTLGITEIVPGCANYLMLHLPPGFPSAIQVIRDCRARGLFLRDIRTMGATLDAQTLRIAVKDAVTNERIIAILRDTVSETSCNRRNQQPIMQNRATVTV